MVTEKKRIFVTGGSGQTGCHCLKHLASKYGEQFDIQAGVYTDKQDEQTATIKRHFPAHVDVVPIDAEDVEGCVEAFKGVSGLFIVPSATEAKVRHARNYLKAAKKANVPFVLVLSMTGSEEREGLFACQFNDIEEEVRRLQLPAWCILRSNFYAQNLLLYKEQISQQGKLPLPIAESAKFAPVDADDVGRAAAEILAHDDQHKQKVYHVTGPELLTGSQLAEQLHVAMGKPVQWTTLEEKEARQILQSQQVPAPEIQGLLEFYRVASAGKAAWLTKDYQTITGEQPTSMKDFMKRHMDELASSTTTSGSKSSTSSQPSQEPSSQFTTSHTQKATSAAA